MPLLCTGWIVDLVGDGYRGSRISGVAGLGVKVEFWVAGVKLRLAIPTYIYRRALTGYAINS